MPNFKATVRLTALTFALAVATLPGARQPAQAAIGLGRDSSPDATAQAAATGLVAAISAGVYHTCALKDGGAWCWGYNTWGQLGNGTTSSFEPRPVQVSGLASGVSAITAGGEHTCALKDGGAWCWGSNVMGELGIGTTPFYSTVPVAVGGLESGVSAISASYSNTCALKDGGAWCWGENISGQLGNGGNSGPELCTGVPRACSTTPVAVSGLGSGVSAISTGGSHACALKDGGAWCWGRNEGGMLGNNSQTGSNVPVRVSDSAGFTNSGVSAISAGSSHTCALKDSGAWCWGDNSVGELGIGANTGPELCPYACSTTPVAVSGLGGGISAISTGEHTCALKNGGAWCWGNNSLGELGIGTNAGPEVCWGAACSTTPLAVSDLGGGVSTISAGVDHTCALKGGAEWCWGYSSFGQLGNGDNLGPEQCILGDSYPCSTIPVAVLWPWKLPYAPNAAVRWTGGPHALNLGGAYTAPFPAGQGSGLDFAGGAFQVRAIANGTVVKVNNICSSTALGCFVAIKHDGSGSVAVYAHLASGLIQVSEAPEGQEPNRVVQSQPIATAGGTGTGANGRVHLHLEIRKGNTTVSDCTGQDDCFGAPLDWDGTTIDGWQIHEYFTNDQRQWAYNYDGSATKGAVTDVLNFPYLDEGVTNVWRVWPAAAVATVGSTFHCTYPTTEPTPPYNSCEKNGQSQPCYSTPPTVPLPDGTDCTTLTQFATLDGGDLQVSGASGGRAMAPPLGVADQSAQLLSSNGPATVAVGGIAEQPDPTALRSETSSATADNRIAYALWGAAAAALAIVAAGGWALRRRRSE